MFLSARSHLPFARPKGAFAQAVPAPSHHLLESLSPGQRERFFAEDRQMTLNNALMGTWVVIFLVPFCWVMDWVVYPDQAGLFLGLRLLCSACCLPILWLVHHPWGRRHYRAFPVILPALPAFFISLMIYLGGSAESDYYAGLTLCIVGASCIFNWTIREIGLTLGIVFTFYLAATVPLLKEAPTGISRGIFINNTLFMLTNCFVLYVSSRLHQNTRLREFISRCMVEDQREELSRRNEELTSTFERLHATEAQLDHSERLASIGRLSAGIIHEINNPLNFVKSALYVLGKKASKMPGDMGESVREIASDVSEGVDRVVAIISDLRAFSHPDQRTLEQVNLAEVIHKTFRFVDTDVGHRRSQIEINVPDDLAFFGDESQVMQVIINVVQNSIDAMRHTEAPKISIIGWSTPERVCLSIEDNGSGMSGETIKKIFDPFFTTKEVGSGMGLGLSLCYRMMQQMEGDIEVESQEGEFTRFTLSFQHSSHTTEDEEAACHES